VVSTHRAARGVESSLRAAHSKADVWFCANTDASNNASFVGLRDSVNNTANEAGQRIGRKIFTPADLDGQARISGARGLSTEHRCAALCQPMSENMTKLKLGRSRTINRCV